MRFLLNAVVCTLLVGALFAAGTPDASAREFTPKIKAGQACPSLTPVDQWVRKTIHGDILTTKVFCGDFNADGHADAIAFVFYNPPGGNGIFDKIALFRNAQGKLRYLRPVSKLFGQPQDASFASGQIAMDMLTLTDTDAACCPSGRSREMVDVKTGKAKP